MGAREKPEKIPTITFIDKDAKGIVPHQDDPIAVSLITTGYQISRLLVYGGSSANVIFWTYFKHSEYPKTSYDHSTIH